MADTKEDPAVAMFRQIIEFDEINYRQLPDQDTADQRVQMIADTRRHLISDVVERGSYDVYVVQLINYKDMFENMYAHLPMERERRIKYRQCVIILKLLIGRFRMRMLLHDLQQIYEGLV